MPSWKQMSVLLSCSAIRKSYGTRVLFENLSLSLSEGDRTGLIGPNGSGKTTLLEILAGNDVPDSGERAVRKHTRLAYVPQDSLFAAEDTVASVLEAALADVHLEDREKTTRIEMMLRRAGFENPAARAAALSGGWRKRLAIAAALITSPDVLLLDEPTNHLDLDGILWLERAIAAANSCLVVTHDRYFLENVATRMVEINPAYPRKRLPGERQLQRIPGAARRVFRGRIQTAGSPRHQSAKRSGVASPRTQGPHRKIEGAY